MLSHWSYVINYICPVRHVIFMLSDNYYSVIICLNKVVTKRHAITINYMLRYINFTRPVWDQTNVTQILRLSKECILQSPTYEQVRKGHVGALHQLGPYISFVKICNFPLLDTFCSNKSNFIGDTLMKENKNLQ